MFDKLKQLGEIKKMRDQISQIQKQLAQEEITIEEQGVKVVINGEQQIRKLEVKGLSNQVLVDVLNKAIKESQKIAASKLYNLSGGLGGLMGK